MADTVLLPGTTIEVIKKYETDRRLDFPDFSEVCKSSFAKGVISDFKVTKEDPITVESLVKVTGEWGESEYIPLVFKPKSLYWDDETAVLATDFDEETGCFKRAWQSFRCGDEVAVMLKEDVPVAVIAFVDGAPRIGEDIVKLATPSEHSTGGGGFWPDAYVQMSRTRFHAKGPDGPDDAPLKLLQQVDPHLSTETFEEYSVWIDPGEDWDWPPCEQPPDCEAPYGTTSSCQGNCSSWSWGILGLAGKETRNVVMWPVKIGPILYAIFGMWFHHCGVNCTGYGTGTPESEGILTQKQNIYGFERLMVKAGVFSEELLQEAIDSLGNFTVAEAEAIDENDDWWPETPNDLIRQTDLTSLLNSLVFFDSPSIEGVEVFSRPHTKAELEAAGLWPVPA